jgi:hypothetical protein
MSDDYTFRPDLKDKARHAMERAVKPQRYGNPYAARNATAVQKIELRVARIRNKLRAHQYIMNPVFTAREEQKLRNASPLKMNLDRSGGLKPPPGAPFLKHAHHQSISEKAQANVTRRCNERVRTLESIERRMMRKLSRPQSRSR